MRTWRWRTVADPNRPTPAQCKAFGIPRAPNIPHPLAHRVGEPVVCGPRGRNGNERMVFADGSWTIAPWRAALSAKP
jgi:hypothetical protein